MPLRNPALSLALLGLLAAPISPARADPAAWPSAGPESRPWTRWWWPGSAVDREGLTTQLEQFAAAGLGGVEITPIYGAKGAEARYLPFLSDRWLEMLEHAGREARRLGLGLDLATGTGWPFGGPWVEPGDGLQRLVLKDGRLTGEPGRMQVKRAAPGGEGLVVDPYSAAALGRYLAPFERAFTPFPRELIRSQFHDSFEYFNASWTARLPTVFRARHGYDLQDFAAALAARDPGTVATVDRETLARVKADYRDTLGALHLEYLQAWVGWSHRLGFKVRNQSHGAPANLLDLYGAVDIPETEIFGSTPFPIPGLRREPAEVRHDQDLPEPLVVRLASSAAHVLGKPLASAESATWLREHWKEAPAHVKPELDRVFTDGVNHVFYHGTVYSPRDAAWPGWLFYASTQFHPRNPWWRDFGALNRYVTRVQSVLQRGRPDQEVLLYWPAADVWDDPAGLAKMLTVHHVGWLTEQPVGRIARRLLEQGYAFDYVSDLQLRQARVERGAVATPGARYRVLVVPAARRMPAETLQRIAALARAGAAVVFEALPEDVPGQGRLARRRLAFRQALADLAAAKVPVTRDLPAALAPLARREPWAREGLTFARRAVPEGRDYFIAHLGARPHRDWIDLGAAAAVHRLDPLDGRVGALPRRITAGGSTEAWLELEPGESVILRALTAAPDRPVAAWPVLRPAGSALVVEGVWEVAFLEGGPGQPPAFRTRDLRSWTELGGAEAQRFAGTARYRLEFEAPTEAVEHWRLELGDVRETARVRINGHDAGTAWSVPFQLPLRNLIRPGRNVLEIEVTNLAANRIRDLDRRKVDWKIMREINFVDINYRPFDASSWPLTPSGLLGPVRLIPLRETAPGP